jgi:ATP-dependent exoDNAse (exonuclease V) beta subunit
LEEVRELAAAGGAPMPREVAPIPVDHTAQRQFSFSRLTGQLIQTHIRSTAPGSAGGSSVYDDLDTENPRQSRGLSTKSYATADIDARGFGTLVHDVLERINFASGATAGLPSSAEISAWCEHLAPAHVIQNTEHAARLASQMIERFVASPRGCELATAKAIHREIDFLLAWPPDAPNPNGQYIQGVIDCLYQDAAGNWHILDFKTNDVSAKGASKAAQPYELQLQVYAIAIERALRQSPAKLVLHFLRPGVEHIIPWNDAARARAIKLVSDAIMSITKL